MRMKAGQTERAQRLLLIANELAAEHPLVPQNQAAAKELLAQAKQKLIPPIPKPVVEQAGKIFVEAARTDPKAWEVASDFMNYRSILNSRISLNNGIILQAQPVSQKPRTTCFGRLGKRTCHL